MGQMFIVLFIDQNIAPAWSAISYYRINLFYNQIVWFKVPCYREFVFLKFTIFLDTWNGYIVGDDVAVIIKTAHLTNSSFSNT